MSVNVLYRFFDADDTLLYVGITASPPRRFREHQNSKAWWTEVAKITVDPFATRSGLELAERYAIRAECPRYNVTHNDQRKQGKSTQRDQAPPSALINASHAVLECCAVESVGPRKVNRLVRQFKSRAPQAGIDVYLMFLARSVQMNARQHAMASAIAHLMMPSAWGSRDGGIRRVRLESGAVTVPLGATTGVRSLSPPVPTFPVEIRRVAT